jgi:hypothetical protein
MFGNRIYFSKAGCFPSPVPELQPVNCPLKPFWIGHHRLRRLAAGHFSLKPMSYEIYTPQSPERRVRFDVVKPTTVWWNRI